MTAIKRIFEAWGSEFEKKDSLARADNIRFMSLFKSSNIKAKTWPYEARDDDLSRVNRCKTPCLSIRGSRVREKD